MTLFRPPSPSLDSTSNTSTTNDPEPKRVRQPTKHQSSHLPRRPHRSHKLDKVKAAIKDAAKRVQKNKKRVEPCNVFVGNIGPDVDEDALRKYFSCCGKILAVEIHCCGGVAMTVKPPPASYHQNMKVCQYAIITFGSKLARRRACKLQGTLAGCQLKASILISDLPEVREKITKRLEEYRLRQEPADVHRAQRSALKSLKIDATELLDTRYERERRKRQNVFDFMGLSLFQVIM